LTIFLLGGDTLPHGGAYTIDEPRGSVPPHEKSAYEGSNILTNQTGGEIHRNVKIHVVSHETPRLVSSPPCRFGWSW